MDLSFLSRIIGFIIALTVHEFAHALIAFKLGDPTAKYKGRLTLNPIKHIDPFGTVLLPIALSISSPYTFGYAKPVPINPYNLKGRHSEIWVSLAGPFSNFIVAFLTILFYKLTPDTVTANWSKDFIDLIMIIFYTNIAIGVFNLIPVAPLDGSKILMSLLPYSLHRVKEFIQNYSLFILIFIILFGRGFLSALIILVAQIITGLVFWLTSFL
ncbi:MAG: site-2 protease family protein [Candidatus Moranbacteria bacterium]|nr:site-2 protease family protein [Candidatus Moranbacteria bacterium]